MPPASREPSRTSQEAPTYFQPIQKIKAQVGIKKSRVPTMFTTALALGRIAR
jgi:hypothetical protein